jgi:hypothetical protein
LLVSLSLTLNWLENPLVSIFKLNFTPIHNFMVWSVIWKHGTMVYVSEGMLFPFKDL